MEHSRRGQSLVEVLVAVAFGALMIGAAAAFIAPALRATQQTNRVQAAAGIGKELSDNVQAWVSGNWDNVLNVATGSSNNYYLVTSASPFTLVSNASETVVVSGLSYSRYFYMSDVYRDSNGAVTSTVAGNSYDPSSKQVTVVYGAVGAKKNTLTTYVTRNAANVLVQSDWSGSVTNNSLAVISNQVSANVSTTISTPGAITLTGAGSYPATGTVDSATFDTGVASGTQLNAVTWQGTLPAGTSVKFQFAVSNATSGWNFIGPDTTSGSWFTSGTGSPVQLIGNGSPPSYTIFNGYRYFRYRIELLANGGLTLTPTVNSVIVNWSP